MALKIDLLNPTFSQYSVLQHFTDQMSQALQRHGVKTHLLTLDDPQIFLQQIQEHDPNYTLSFNEIESDPQGRFLCDLMKIPHINIIVDRPDHYFVSARGNCNNILNSRYSVLTFPDRAACRLLESLGHTRTFFLPHAVERDLNGPVDSDRPYPITMLCSLYDYQHKEAQWKVQYPSHIIEAMEKTLHECLSNKHKPYYETFASALGLFDNGIYSPDIVQYGPPLNALEEYIRGFDRIALLRSITDVPIHLFGTTPPSADWESYLHGQRNITIHPPVSYDEALAIMKQSKVLLNSSPTIYEGGHERIFTGMACGAVVVTQENPYLSQYYTDNRSILFRSDITGLVIQNLLDDDKQRQSIAAEGQRITYEHHTWDHRAETLLNTLENY
ncbi:MAG: glycosyltransferase family 1 protein [Chlamydiales bacterium]|nr:glycosyltransferase family 1 protein [Chlamydiia bacterium]MCP5507386.1 glycosyltransferase family 1 protein [Chlamydiales bacterium]